MAKKRTGGGGQSDPIKNLMYAAQDGKCFFCHRQLRRNRRRQCKITNDTLTLEHLVPQCFGGWSVLVAACWQCNNKKGDRPPSREELETFRLIIETSIYANSARSFRDRALNEVSYWLKNMNKLQGQFCHE